MGEEDYSRNKINLIIEKSNSSEINNYYYIIYYC